MKNAPECIFLKSYNTDPDAAFNPNHYISWHLERSDETDIEYTLAADVTEIVKSYSTRQHELEEANERLISVMHDCVNLIDGDFPLSQGTAMQIKADLIAAIENHFVQEEEQLEANGEGIYECRDNEGDYLEWKKELIKVTFKELEEHGISGSEFKINDVEARRCFDSGMSPYYTFREHFSLNALES